MTKVLLLRRSTKTNILLETGSYYVSLKSDSGTWDTGKYKVDLYLNNNYYKTVTFEVQ